MRSRRKKNVLETPGGWSGQVTLSLFAHPIRKVWTQKQQTKQNHSSWPVTSASSHPSEHFLCLLCRTHLLGCHLPPLLLIPGKQCHESFVFYNTGFLSFISEFFPAVFSSSWLQSKQVTQRQTPGVRTVPGPNFDSEQPTDAAGPATLHLPNFQTGNHVASQLNLVQNVLVFILVIFMAFYKSNLL